MSDALHSPTGQEMTRPERRLSQAELSRDGLPGQPQTQPQMQPQMQPRRVLRGRARALAATRAGRWRRGYTHWSAWIAYSAVLLLVGILVRWQWPDAGAAVSASAAALAEMAEQDPALDELAGGDPDAYAWLRNELAQALDTGLSRGEALAQARAVLRARGPALVARARARGVVRPPDPPGVEALPQAEGSDYVELGALGERIGVARLKTRKCSGSGPEAECIELFEDPDSLTPGQGGPSAQERVEIFRRKTQEAKKALEGL